MSLPVLSEGCLPCLTYFLPTIFSIVHSTKNKRQNHPNVFTSGLGLCVPSDMFSNKWHKNGCTSCPLVWFYSLPFPVSMWIVRFEWVSKVDALKVLVLRVMLSEGGRVFRRWSLVGNIWVIKSNPLKEVVKPWPAGLLLLPESQYHCCAGPQSSSYRMLPSVGSPSCVTPSLEVEPLKQ